MKKCNRIENGFNAINNAKKRIADIGNKLNKIQKEFNNIMDICDYHRQLGKQLPESLKELAVKANQQLQLTAIDLNRLISYAIYYKKELLKNKRFLNADQLKQLNELDDAISNIGKKIDPTIHGMILQLKMTALGKSSKALLAQLRHINSARRTLVAIRTAWRTGGKIAFKVRW